MSDKAVINPWDCPQEKAEIRQWVYLSAPNIQNVGDLDPQAQETLREFLDAPTVEINYELNDETDYAMPYRIPGKPITVARISDFVTINGVRWFLVPGKNIIPRPVYEFLMQVEDMKKAITILPGQSMSLGMFKATGVA